MEQFWSGHIITYFYVINSGYNYVLCFLSVIRGFSVPVASEAKSKEHQSLVSLTRLQTDGCLPEGLVSSCAEGGGMLMEDVGWSGGAAAQAPGEGWTELSNTLPCCERGHQSFRSS